MRLPSAVKSPLFPVACLLLLAAAVPRLWALGWGLPLKYAHIDESVVTFYAARALAGEADPAVFFDYPGLFLYLLAAVFRVVMWLRPSVTVVSALEAYAAGDAAFFTWMARSVSAAAGIASVLVLYRMGVKRGGPFVGATAALSFVWDPLHVLHSHYGTVDGLALLLALLALDRTADYWRDGRERDGLWAAFLVGLAAAAKYYPGILFLAVLPVPFMLRRPHPVPVAGALALAAAGGFLAGSPYTLLAPVRFWERFSHMAPKFLSGNPSGFSGSATLGFLFHEAGPALLAAGAVGLWLALRGGAREWKALAWTWAGLLLFLSLWRIQSAHYGLLLHPLLALFAARALDALGARRQALAWVGAAFLAVSFLPALVRDLRMLSTPDTRLRARGWIAENVPPGSRVLRFAHSPEFKGGDPYRVRVDWENALLKASDEELAAALVPYDYVLHATYDESEAGGTRLQNHLKWVHREAGPAPRFPHHPIVTIWKKEKK